MKKGLSPLIATVLLIGITISLAALVMVWGQALFKQTTEDTGKSAQAEINCISKVQVDILNASCDGVPGGGPGGTPMNLIVDNKNEEPIHGFIIRFYSASGNVETITISSVGFALPLDSFNARTYSVPYSGGEITKVDVIPQIKLDDGTLRACGQKIDTFTLISPNLEGGCS